jgi:membrane protease YdiL (CAAX protease family)
MDATIETPDMPPPREPRAWKFWGTLAWGLLIFVAMGIGQIAMVGYFVWSHGGSLDAESLIALVGNGRTIALSVLAGLPPVLAALWLAIRFTRMPFTDYLALRGFSWKLLLIGIVALAVLSQGWDWVAQAVGHEVSPGFMGEVLKSARAENSLWILVLSFCVAAPMTEELMTRGFLYRGWSESFLRPFGAIILSTLVWTGMHLQYDAFFLGQVFSIGLLFGYLRYRSNSTWLTIALHGLNNLAATSQTIYLLSNA